MLNITNVLNISYSFYIIIHLCMKCSQTKSQPFQFCLGLIKNNCSYFHPLRFSAYGVGCIYSAGIECSLVVLTETDPAQHATVFVAAFCHIVIMKEPMFCKEIRGRH